MNDKKQGNRRPTSHDVAREAGVSRATVSYVLNRSPLHPLPEATRQRVLEAASRLGYIPSPAAKTLRSGRSDIVLHLFPDWPIDSVIGTGLSALTHALLGHGLVLVTYVASTGRQCLASLRSSMAPAAVLAYEALDPKDAASLRDAGIPLLELDIQTPDIENNPLLGHEYLVGKLQAEHLIARGHRRLGYCNPADSRMHGFAAIRARAVAAVCAKAGIPPPALLTISNDTDVVMQTLDEECRKPPSLVTGLCAFNDDTALAVLAAARRIEIEVPRDLAVVGVGDTASGRYAEVPLTTIAPHLDRMAGNVAQHIAESLSRETRPITQLCLPVVELIQRQSA